MLQSEEKMKGLLPISVQKVLIECKKKMRKSFRYLNFKVLLGIVQNSFWIGIWIWEFVYIYVQRESPFTWIFSMGYTEIFRFDLRSKVSCRLHVRLGMRFQFASIQSISPKQNFRSIQKTQVNASKFHFGVVIAFFSVWFSTGLKINLLDCFLWTFSSMGEICFIFEVSGKIIRPAYRNL